jgi:hypothetical protein
MEDVRITTLARTLGEVAGMSALRPRRLLLRRK